MSVKHLLGLTSFAVVAACTNPGHTISLGSQRQGIIGGTTDSGDPAVALIFLEDAQGNPYASCSGELISPKIVLSAGHCTDNTAPDSQTPKLDHHQVAFVTGFDWNTGQFTGLIELHDTVSSTPNPGWTGDPGNGSDLGLLVLDAPATKVTPIPYNKSPLGQSYVGQNARFVGWGVTSNTDMSTSTEKRQVSTPLSAVLSNPALTEFDSNTKGACEGDSGGPQFLTIGGQEVIVSITSFGYAVCGQGYDTEIGSYSSWIDSFIAANDPTGSSGPSCGADGQCASGCSSPDPDCPCAADGFCTSACSNPANDPDCTTTNHCGADGVCQATGCATPDPDCGTVNHCGSDGVCDTSCSSPDPDCNTNQCGADGVCDTSCATDPDCTATNHCGSDGVCQSSGCGTPDPDCNTQPGTGNTGDDCSADSDCASGLCISRQSDPTQKYCTETCTGDSSCPASMQCVAASGGTSICTFKVPGQTGGSSGGCSVAAGREGHGAAPVAAVVLGLLGMAIFVRRRK